MLGAELANCPKGARKQRPVNNQPESDDAEDDPIKQGSSKQFRRKERGVGETWAWVELGVPCRMLIEAEVVGGRLLVVASGVSRSAMRSRPPAACLAPVPGSSLGFLGLWLSRPWLCPLPASCLSRGPIVALLTGPVSASLEGSSSLIALAITAIVDLGLGAIAGEVSLFSAVEAGGVLS